MAKLGAKAYNFRAFFNAPTEIFLVLTGFFRLGVTSELFGQVNVLDGQQPKVYVVIEGFGADHFLTAEPTAFKGFAITGVERPFVFALEMLDDVLKKPYRSQAAVLLAAVPTVFQVHLLALVCLVTALLSVVERHHATLDLVLDRIVRPPQMLGYAVGRPTVFQPNFNFVSFFAHGNSIYFLPEERYNSNMEIENLKKTIITIREPRRISYGNIRHRLDDIIIIGLCTVICGGEDYNDMEEFGLEREEWLRTFLELPNGIPDSDTFRRLFERINPKELSECLYDWLNMERDKRSVVAIDGKTIRGSGNTEHKAYHVVSAFVAENQITLGEIVVDEKSNEITAVPELLDIIDVEGAIVTADAMSCQKDITKKITERKADYVLGLKDNQPQLKKDVSDYFFSAIQAPDIYGTPISTETLEKGHGRIEKREYFLITDTDWLDQKDEWSALNGIGMVRTEVDIKGEISSDTRYFITSLTNIDEFAYSVRRHWSIENQLHWNLDVIFREDDARARKDNSPLNMNILRKTALALVNQAKYGRLSKKKMMFKAALNPQVLLDIIFPKK